MKKLIFAFTAIMFILLGKAADAQDVLVPVYIHVTEETTDCSTIGTIIAKRIEGGELGTTPYTGPQNNYLIHISTAYTSGRIQAHLTTDHSATPIYPYFGRCIDTGWDDYNIYAGDYPPHINLHLRPYFGGVASPPPPPSPL